MMAMRGRVDIFILLSYLHLISFLGLGTISYSEKESTSHQREGAPGFPASRAPSRPDQSDMLTPNSESKPGDTGTMQTPPSNEENSSYIWSPAAVVAHLISRIQNHLFQLLHFTNAVWNTLRPTKWEQARGIIYSELIIAKKSSTITCVLAQT